jgi:hypothetical protein
LAQKAEERRTAEAQAAERAAEAIRADQAAQAAAQKRIAEEEQATRAAQQRAERDTEAARVAEARLKMEQTAKEAKAQRTAAEAAAQVALEERRRAEDALAADRQEANSIPAIKSGAGKASATPGDWRHLLAGSAIVAAIGIGAILLPDRAPTEPLPVAVSTPTDLRLRLDYGFSQFGTHRTAETKESQRDYPQPK